MHLLNTLFFDVDYKYANKKIIKKKFVVFYIFAKNCNCVKNLEVSKKPRAL